MIPQATVVPQHGCATEVAGSPWEEASGQWAAAVRRGWGSLIVICFCLLSVSLTAAPLPLLLCRMSIGDGQWDCIVIILWWCNRWDFMFILFGDMSFFIQEKQHQFVDGQGCASYFPFIMVFIILIPSLLWEEIGLHRVLWSGTSSRFYIQMRGPMKDQKAGRVKGQVPYLPVFSDSHVPLWLLLGTAPLLQVWQSLISSPCSSRPGCGHSQEWNIWYYKTNVK